MLSESYLKKKILAELRKYGWFVKYSGGMYSISGIPDVLGCIEGYFIAIEIKTEKGVISELQKKNIRVINKKGKGFSFVCFGWNDFLKKFNELKESIYGRTKERTGDSRRK